LRQRIADQGEIKKLSHEWLPQSDSLRRPDRSTLRDYSFRLSPTSVHLGVRAESTRHVPAYLRSQIADSLNAATKFSQTLVVAEGKACPYFKQLADLDRSTLEKLVVGSVAEVRRRYG
jgi:hypothetical protein